MATKSSGAAYILISLRLILLLALQLPQIVEVCIETCALLTSFQEIARFRPNLAFLPTMRYHRRYLFFPFQFPVEMLHRCTSDLKPKGRIDRRYRWEEQPSLHQRTFSRLVEVRSTVRHPIAMLTFKLLDRTWS